MAQRVKAVLRHGRLAKSDVSLTLLLLHPSSFPLHPSALPSTSISRMQPFEPLISKQAPPVKRVLVCQNRTCRKQGADKVLAAFQARPVSGVAVVASSCLGQCGNGPMVCVLPDTIWYSQVHPDEVATVVDRHLINGQPVQTMLYSKPYLQLPVNNSHQPG